ncbi:MAG: AlpA family phage regulatory protein [Desulfuromonadales bacterium]|nr:AlpA family phage regulatory protein [Desulfuromonadales bacterium]
MGNPSAAHYPLIIRRSQLKPVVGLSPSTVDRLPDFPPKRRYSAGVVGWDGQEVAAWVAEKRREG